jgi:ADP-ribosylglycohydrolase
MLGGAVGDAFGYAVEFSSLPEIRKRFGEKGIQTPVAQGGKLTVSDDTQMTLFTLEGLLKALAHGERWREACLPSIRIAYLNWLRTQTNRCETPGSGWLAAQPVMQARRAPGNTCLSALGAGGRGTIQKPINDSKGCGGVMRVAPIGLVGDRAGPQEIFQVAAESAALTHGHPSGYLSAGVMACLTYLLVQGTDLKQALEKSRTILEGFPHHDETSRIMALALALETDASGNHDAAIRKLGGGWVGEEALAIGVYAALSASTFVEALAIAANHSGDSDSTASIAGQLWGAMKGLGGMPHDWAVNLDVWMPLLRLVRELGELKRPIT